MITFFKWRQISISILNTTVSCLQLRVTGCQFSCMIDTKLLSLKNSYNESSISSEISCSSNSSSSSSLNSWSGWSAYLEILYLLVKQKSDQSYHIFIPLFTFSTTFAAFIWTLNRYTTKWEIIYNICPNTRNKKNN